MNYEDEAAKISAEIDRWQSPRVGLTGRRGRRSFEEDTNKYLMEEDNREGSFISTPSTPAVSLMKRMGTPASNNADPNVTDGDKMDEDEYVPYEIQSPWVPRSVASTTPIVRRSNPSFQSSHTDYQRYYDASLTYLRDRRRLSERMVLLNEKAELFQDAMMVVDENESAFAGDRKLIKDESQAELELLRALNFACWDRSSAVIDDTFRKEGNFWLLLYFLRQQGTTSLLWDDSPLALRSYNKSISSYLESQATYIKRNDKELLDALICNGTGCPLVLKRRQRILAWLEKCFEDILPSDATRPRKTTYLENAKLTREGLPETDKDAEIFKCVLALILSGRVSDAKKLARDSGIPWRAAVWGGGSPADGTGGNPRRFLWKRMMWIQAEKLSEQKGGSPDEVAISALLSSNLSVALSNSSCRTWHHGLYATIRAMLDRTEDDLLHFRNNNRRRMIPCFPVAEHEEVESAYLKGSAEVAGWNERDAIHILKTAPFENMQGSDTIERAIASFVIGRESISEFMSEAMNRVNSESSLRFLTHIALYIDSLSSSTNQISLVGSMDWKNELLSRYVEHLASREDLWYMIVLYASMLPEAFILEKLPLYLTPIESPQEREVVVRQLRELLAGDDWDSEVLKRTVAIILDEDDSLDDTKNVTHSDYKKMKAVDWLKFDDRHCGEALVVANRLIRQFLFLADKTISANTFISDVPDELLDNVSKLVEILEADNLTVVEQEVRRLRLKQAHSEFVAFKGYLNALNSYEEWNYVERTSESTLSAAASLFDETRLNDKEIEIARREKCRQLISQKRDISGAVVSAANAAQSALRAVLEHPGGWLVTEDEVVVESDADTKRLLELGTLRSSLIPGVVKLYQDMCFSAAEWMAVSLDDLALQLEQNRQSALHSLDESSLGFESAVSPKYWAKQGIELLNIVSSEKDKVESVLGPDDLNSILETTCRLAIIDMHY